jgi:hypothetical protein
MDSIDFRIILSLYDYCDIEDPDSDSEDEDPDRFEPSESIPSSPWIQAIYQPAPSLESSSSYKTLPSTPILPPKKLVPAPILPGATVPPPETKKLHYHTIGARIQAVTLFENGFTQPQVTEKTGVGKSALYALRTKAVSCGWMPSKVLETWHVDDAPCPGRPKISTALSQFIIETLTKNSTTRSWLYTQIASEVSSTSGWQPVSVSTVYRTLTSEGYRVFKRTVKPGFTKEQMAEQLKWCLDHRDKDWRYVIFSDKTSVQLEGVKDRRHI